MTTPPSSMTDLARQVGFEIRAWDDTRGEVRALPARSREVTFLGTHEELRSFLTAFGSGLEIGIEEGRAAALRELREATTPKPWRHLLVLRSAGLATPETPSCEAFARPWVPFRGERIAIVDDIARHFDVVDVRVGSRSQLLGTGDQVSSALLYATRLDRRAVLSLSSDGTAHRLHVEHEAEEELGRALHMETCQTAQDLVVSARLRRGSPATAFEVLILGMSASGS